MGRADARWVEARRGCRGNADRPTRVQQDVRTLHMCHVTDEQEIGFIGKFPEAWIAFKTEVTDVVGHEVLNDLMRHPRLSEPVVLRNRVADGDEPIDRATGKIPGAEITDRGNRPLHAAIVLAGTVETF
jgi:hypothetical protein